GGGEAVRDAAPRPEGHAVVAAAPGVRPARTLAVPLRVHEPRVHPPEVLERDAEPLAGVGQEVRQKHVRALDQAVDERPPLVGADVEADAALVSADLLDDEVAARRAGDEATGDEAADRV